MNQPSNTLLAKILTVDCQDIGQRLDNYLIRSLFSVPKSHIYKIIRKGEIRVNSGRKKASYKLEEGDKIRIPPMSMAEKLIKKLPLYDVKSWVLFENEKIIVINKPFGLAVHGGSGVNFGLIELVRKHYNSNDINLVHRLDRETSGCIVLARKRNILRQLHAQFRDNEVKKTYLTLLNGKLAKSGIIRTYIKKNVLCSGERIVKVAASDDGKEAITNFRVLGIKNNITLSMVKIHTGRTHQIRVQASELKAPVIGDDKYGVVSFNKKFFQEEKQSRMLLHAYRIEFLLAGSAYVFNAPLDDLFQKCLWKNNFSAEFDKN